MSDVNDHAFARHHDEDSVRTQPAASSAAYSGNPKKAYRELVGDRRA
jgi:hypothetical protein